MYPNFELFCRLYVPFHYCRMPATYAVLVSLSRNMKQQNIWRNDWLIIIQFDIAKFYWDLSSCFHFRIYRINLMTTSYQPFFSVPPGLTSKNTTCRSLCVECFVRISEQTATFALYIIDWLAFITVVEGVYCVVRTDSLYKADYVSSLKD